MQQEPPGHSSEKDSKMEVFSRWLLTQDREERIKLTPVIFPGKSREEAEKMADEAGFLKDEKPGHPSWSDFYAAKSRQEKEAILHKIFKGSLTSEEIELFFPKDDD